MSPDHDDMPSIPDSFGSTSDKKNTSGRKPRLGSPRWGRRVVRWGLSGLLVFLVLDMGWCFLGPDVSELATSNPQTTAFMEYRLDQWRKTGREEAIILRWTPLGKMSKPLVMAVLIGEDDKFWEHDGFDLEGMRVAIERTLKDGIVAGGSTISQQLVKNLYFSPSKNPVRKFNEAIVTWRLERALPKKRILELYLNVIEWGDGIFGIGSAAQHYFGKSPAQLTRRESALLSAALPNPIRWSPTGNSRTIVYRSKLILQRMNRRINLQEEWQRKQDEKKAEGES